MSPLNEKRSAARPWLAAGLFSAAVVGSGLAGFAAPTGKAGVGGRQKAVSTKPKPAVSSQEPGASVVQYNRDVRPILSDNCFACHGPDKSTRAANLRLDVREEALKRGVFVPGKPDSSVMMIRINTAKPELLMPPVTAHKTLKVEQKELLRRWIAQGAKYEAHWAFTPIQRPEIPKLTDPRYAARNPIDAFVRARLAEKKILPSAEADPRTLLRRVTLDLTGLPPTPEEVSAYLANRSPDAYEKVVDRLLASPHFGERMASPWLDVVRYADTVGFHGDQNQNAWAYRDYVIDAYNRDKPFDQFTIEQLAGDLLPNPTPEQLTATCFNRLTMMTREGGAQPREYLAKYQADRVRTVGMAWMGATLGCAECHDHKFDPYSQKDFYALSAFFADMRQWGVYADYNYTPNPDLRGYNNDFPFPPEIKVENRYLKERIQRQRARLAVVRSVEPAPDRQAFDAWRAEMTSFLGMHPEGWSTPVPAARTALYRAPRAPAPTGTPPPATVEADRSVTLAGKSAADLELILPLDVSRVAAVKVEVLPRERDVFRGTATTLTLNAAVLQGTKVQPVSFRYAGADRSEPRYRSGFEIVGVHGGWKLSTTDRSIVQVSVWLPTIPLLVKPGDRLRLTLPNVPAAKVRVSISPLTPDQPDALDLPLNLKSALAAGASPTEQARVYGAYLNSTAWNKEAFAQARELEADILECRGGITSVMVTEATTPRVTRVLPRGNWQDESGPVVTPAVPAFLPGYQASPGQRLTRLDLAKWLVSKENPLTARVYVNRVWKQFFGSGLSPLVEDLGAQGETPSHPELLDFLASAFSSSASETRPSAVTGVGMREGERGKVGVLQTVATSGPSGSSAPIHPRTQSSTQNMGWSTKSLVKLIVMSATYRQSSSLRPELRELDPNNRLLASQNPRRLEAELVRDNALAVAGLLNRDMGGPPVKPYQPEGYYANLQFPDRPYAPEPDDRQWRRGVYVHWQRTFLHPMLAAFDAPSREDCIAARTAANTPQQALTLLNDPAYVEAARVFAGSLCSEKAASDAERLDRAFERAVARPAKPKERESLLAFLKKMREEYGQRPADAEKLLKTGFAPATTGAEPVELAAWTSVCRVILNLQETITRY